MLSLSTVSISTEDPKRLGEFYTKIFGKPQWEEGEMKGWVLDKGFMNIMPHDQIHGQAKEPARIMMMLNTKEVEKEFDRMAAAGAEVVAKPYHPGEDDTMMLATLADPDGNYFQLATPWEG